MTQTQLQLHKTTFWDKELVVTVAASSVWPVSTNRPKVHKEKSAGVQAQKYTQNASRYFRICSHFQTEKRAPLISLLLVVQNQKLFFSQTKKI
jgi:hypothetical protein